MAHIFSRHSKLERIATFMRKQRSKSFLKLYLKVSMVHALSYRGRRRSFGPLQSTEDAGTIDSMNIDLADSIDIFQVNASRPLL